MANITYYSIDSDINGDIFNDDYHNYQFNNHNQNENVVNSFAPNYFDGTTTEIDFTEVLIDESHTSTISLDSNNDIRTLQDYVENRSSQNDPINGGNILLQNYNDYSERSVNSPPSSPSRQSLNDRVKKIQFLDNGNYRVQIKRTSGSPKTFSKNVEMLSDALWLVEIGILICDKPTDSEFLFRKGNYAYLLKEGYVMNATDYKKKLRDYLLSPLARRVLDEQNLYDIARAVLDDLTVL